MSLLPIKRLLWLLGGFLFGSGWMTSFHYGRQLTFANINLPQQRAKNSQSSQSNQKISVPEFQGKIFHLNGPWEYIVAKDQHAEPAQNFSQPGSINTKVTDTEELEWLKVQSQRRNMIDNYCDKHKNLRISYKELKPNKRAQFYKTVLVGAKHKALYCPVGKVACTSWKTAMAMLQGHYDGLRPGEHIHDVQVLQRNDITPLSKVESPDEFLDTYPLFLFVRHPFERLVSAFKNKFHARNGENMQENYGRDIIKRYRPPGEATEEELRTGWGVRFPEFVKWIIDSRVKNIHWNSYNDICHMCSLPYKFIGKMDTFMEDSKYILKHLFSEENFAKFPHSNPSPKSSQVPLETFFNEVPQADVNRLKKMYDMDFKMFNYTWPQKK